MRAEGDGGDDAFRVDGSVLRVDVRPAVLVAQLPAAGGEPFVTTQSVDGRARHRPVVAGVRQGSYRVRDDLTVEATRSSAFVAVADEDGGCVVVAVAGEVVVHPGIAGQGRIALSGQEMFVSPERGTSGTMRVQSTVGLSDEDEVDVRRVLDRVGEVIATIEASGGRSPAVAGPAATAAASEVAAPVDDAEQGTAGAETAETGEVAAAADAGPPEVVPDESKPAASAADTVGDDKAAPDRAAGEKAAPDKEPPSTPADPTGAVPAAAAAKAPPARPAKGKKGKKGKGGSGARPATPGTPGKAGGPTKKVGPQPPTPVGGPTAKAAPAKKATPQKAAAAKAPADRTRSAGVAPPPAKKTTATTKSTTAKSPDDGPPRSRAFVVAGLVAAAVGAILLAYTLSDTDQEVATTPSPTSDTTAPATTTTAAPTTTEAPATTTTAAPTTTEAPATTTTAAPTTAPPAPRYRVDPKSCVQRGNTITYTATIANESDRPFDYLVRVVFVDRNGRRVTSATANVDNLAPGRQADFSATGSSTQDLAAIGATCDVEGIDASPS